jgi:hypothetical protein
MQNNLAERNIVLRFEDTNAMKRLFKIRDMELKITKEKVIEASNKCDIAKQTLKTLFPEVFEEDITYKQGDFFKEDNGDLYVLCQVGVFLACLIAVKGFDVGNRFIEPIKVGDVKSITKAEFNIICSGKAIKFKKVESPFK